jgi:hypothetical protein
MPTGLYIFLNMFPALVLCTSLRATHNLFGPFHDVLTECDCVGTEAIMICFMYTYFERVSRNMSYFGWLFAVLFESKISTGLVVTRQFFSGTHVRHNVKIETFSVRNILLCWLFTCVCFTPSAIAVVARKSCIVHRYLSRVSIFSSYVNYAI